jgi:outer membrane protein
MKKLFSMLLVVGFLLSSISAYAEKIGYIDMDKVMQQSRIGKRYTSILKAEARKVEKQVKSIDAQIKKLSKDLQSSVLSNAIKNKKAQELNKLLMKKAKLIQEFQMKQLKMNRELVLKIAKVVKEYAEKNKYDLILAGGLDKGILFYSDKVDITNEILRYVNQKLK